MSHTRVPARSFLGPVACGVCVAASLLAAPGCNILGPALFMASDDRIPAVFTLNPDKKTVVFIDDRASVLPSRTVRIAIAKAAEKVLIDEKLVRAEVIGSESLQQVLSGERFGKPRSIAEIGRAVGAEQIVYATVDRFALSPNGSEFSPGFTMRVKVLDARNGDRLFPAPAGETQDTFFTLKNTEKTRAQALPKSGAEVTKAQLMLAEEAGRNLGEMFYKHTWRDPNSKIGGV